MSDTIKIETVQSKWRPDLWALSIDGLRCGPDAGPWTVRQTFNVKVSDLRRVLADHDRKDDAA